jgi:hypothetical protein
VYLGGALSKIAVVVCNVCEQLGKPTRPYKVTQGRRSVAVDLCDDDSVSLEALLPGQPAVPKVNAKDLSNGKPAKRRGRGVTPMSEVVAAKKVAKKR